MANVESTPPRILLNMMVKTVDDHECEVLISQYAQRVSDAGAVPVLVPSIEKPEIIESLLDIADGVLLIGGPDYDPRYYGETPHPETSLARKRPHFDLAFAAAALRREVPILGICAGCQLLNIATGGKLIQHLPNTPEHRFTAHSATVTGEGFFARGLGVAPGTTVTVNSFHHQAVDPEHLGSGLRITGRAFDGTVEAIELPGPRMVLGLQFHPERMDDLGPAFFSLLASEARPR